MAEEPKPTEVPCETGLERTPIPAPTPLPATEVAPRAEPVFMPTPTPTSTPAEPTPASTEMLTPTPSNPPGETTAERVMRQGPAIDIDAIRVDIVGLATAIRTMNQYGSRLAKVEEIVNSILAPSPRESAAADSLGALKAARSKLGLIVSIVADWDKDWHFLFQFRFEDGYHHSDGFDLRQGEPGYNALVKAIDVVGLKLENCNVLAPELATNVPARRIIFPKVT